MKVLKKVAAVILGGVLFLAGLLKLMDPLGTSLIVEAYFKFLHLSFLNPASGAFGFAFALIETVLGAAIVTGVWKKVVGWITLGVLGFFTILTLLLVIFNPQMDCGCFGEAIHLTHLQSLIKNLVLLALWALVFVLPGQSVKALKIKYVSFSIVVLSVLLFAIYFKFFSLPAMDFTAYKVGNDINTEILAFYDENGEYCDELALSGDVAVISIYNPKALKPGDWAKLSDFSSVARDCGCQPLILCSGNPSESDACIPGSELSEITYYADRKEIMTLNRSNGGVVLMSDGLIVSKWTLHSLPDGEAVSCMFGKTKVETISEFSAGHRLRLQAFLLYAFAVMLLL